MIIPRPKAFSAPLRRRATIPELPDLGAGPKNTPAPEPIFADRSTDAFFTPPEIAEELIQIAFPGKWQRILEPSAGTGSLIAAALEFEPELYITAVERYLPFVEQLKSRFPDIERHGEDFLEVTPEEIGRFDAIIMNPPFGRRQAPKHVEHARRFLKTGGQITAIVPSTYDGPGTTVRDLPAGTFANTEVRTKIIITS